MCAVVSNYIGSHILYQAFIYRAWLVAFPLTKIRRNQLLLAILSTKVIPTLVWWVQFNLIRESTGTTIIHNNTASTDCDML